MQAIMWMYLKLIGVYSVAPTSLEVIGIVIKDVLLHLEMKIWNMKIIHMIWKSTTISQQSW